MQDIVGPYNQISYVTSHFDTAVETLRTELGMGPFLTIRDMAIQLAPGKRGVIHLGLAYHGNLEMEVIEPVEGDVDIYREKLPRDGSFNMHFHHYARRFARAEDLESVLSDLRAADIPIPLISTYEGTNGFARAFYADYRRTLGHYIEFVHFSESGAALMDTVPRY